MMRRLMMIAAVPVRLALGIPAFHGMTVGNRILHLARGAGLYKGPINFVVRARQINIGVSGRGV
jgi:hypothetical protein